MMHPAQFTVLSVFRSLGIGLAVLLVANLLSAATPSSSEASSLDQWPQWRGPLATGVAPHGQPPVEWSEDKNIRWKISPPGHGHSAPIIWGDHVYLTAAIPYGEPVEPKPDTAPGAHDNLPVTRHHEFAVLAYRRADGELLWQCAVRKELPHEGGHNTGSLASNSPVTDGHYLFAFFGSRGLYCLDREGKVQWEKDWGRMQSRHAHGEGSSPVLHEDKLIVNWDHEGDSFLIALDKDDGRELWKAPRDEMTSWSTPVMAEADGKAQVVVSGTRRVRGYDAETGEVIWECAGLSRNVVASPVAGQGMAFAANSYDWQAMLAIRLAGARGDITGTDRVAWTLNRLTPYVPSPLLYDDALYFLRHNQGILSCLNPRTGEEIHPPVRLPGVRNIFASPVGTPDRIYIADREGAVLVLRKSDVPVVLALNRLDDSFSASPALAGNELYLRGDKHLYCIATLAQPAGEE